MYRFLFSIGVELGSLGFWLAAMIMMPDSVPGYIRLFALSFFWMGIAILARIDAERR